MLKRSKEYIYNGELFDGASDIVVMWNEGYEIRGYLTMGGKMWDYASEWSTHMIGSHDSAYFDVPISKKWVAKF